jgi:hypothetical protein
MAMFGAAKVGVSMKAEVTVNLPNPALERTVNGGGARWFVQSLAAPLPAAPQQR